MNCNIKLFGMENLRLHRYLYHRSGYCCYLCGTKFRTLDALCGHMQAQHLPKLEKCQVCDESMMLPEMSAHSCIESDKLSCEQCAMSFETLFAFIEHLQTGHTRKRRYKCQVCKHIFAARILLDEHAKVHVNSTFTCDICSRMYAKKSNLKLHMETTHGARGKLQ